MTIILRATKTKYVLRFYGKMGNDESIAFGVSFYTLWAIRRVVLPKLMSFCSLKAFYSDEICTQDGFFLETNKLFTLMQELCFIQVFLKKTVL